MHVWHVSIRVFEGRRIACGCERISACRPTVWRSGTQGKRGLPELGVNPIITLSLLNFPERSMNNTAVNSNALKNTASLAGNETLRGLIAAMPIVIFAKAARAALKRSAGARAR